MNKILHRIGTGPVSNRCLFSLSLMVTRIKPSLLSPVGNALPSSKQPLIIISCCTASLLYSSAALSHTSSLSRHTLHSSRLSNHQTKSTVCIYRGTPPTLLPPSSPLSHPLEFSQWKPSREMQHSNPAQTVNPDGNASTFILAFTMHIKTKIRPMTAFYDARDDKGLLHSTAPIIWSVLLIFM